MAWLLCACGWLRQEKGFLFLFCYRYACKVLLVLLAVTFAAAVAAAAVVAAAASGSWYGGVKQRNGSSQQNLGGCRQSPHMYVEDRKP